MIDTDKMKAAFAATPLCQHQWTEKGDDGGATKLCAISALVSFAGVQPELIAKMDRTEREAMLMQTNATTLTLSQVPRWVADLALPVLWAEYGIPRHVGGWFPSIFDGQDNEWQGVVEVLALCDEHNAYEEDAARFPTPILSVTSFDITWAAQPPAVTHLAEKPKGQTDKGKSKFWTATKKPTVPKLLTV